jgi:hypothetical protein
MSCTIEQIREVGAPIAMTIAVSAAARHETVPYVDLARALSKKLKTNINPRHMGHVAAEMMDRIIKVGKDAPPLNTIVVYKGSQLPGEGAELYLKRFLPSIKYKDLTDEQKRVVLEPVHEAVFNFEGWDRVAAKAFSDGLPFIEKEPERGESDGKAKRAGFGGPVESEDHLRLKKFVADNPKLFGAPEPYPKGMTEWRIESGDEIDVCFVTPDELLAVEVKSIRSQPLDLKRGIFQCVKYRAVLEAQMIAKKAEPRVRVRLVSENEFLSEHETLAKLYGHLESRKHSVDVSRR